MKKFVAVSAFCLMALSASSFACDRFCDLADGGRAALWNDVVATLGSVCNETITSSTKVAGCANSSPSQRIWSALNSSQALPSNSCGIQPSAFNAAFVAVDSSTTAAQFLYSLLNAELKAEGCRGN